jgi:nitrogen fixation NifU-like protein
MLTEMAKGKSLEEARKITNKDVAEALEGLPKNKLHCSNLGADALQKAIKNYEDRLAGKVVPEPKRVEFPVISHAHSHGEKCYCPYCNVEVAQAEGVCKSCGHTLSPDQPA